MKSLLLSLLGFLCAVACLIGLGRLRQFILEPDYIKTK
jgi:hypothetical protein